MPPSPATSSSAAIAASRVIAGAAAIPTAARQLRDCFKTELKRRNLGPLVRANQAGCLDQCELGPTVVIYPQEIWYGGVKLEDVPRIIEETIIGGRVLEDLLIPDEKLNARRSAAKPRIDDSRPGVRD